MFVYVIEVIGSGIGGNVKNIWKRKVKVYIRLGNIFIDNVLIPGNKVWFWRINGEMLKN